MLALPKELREDRWELLGGLWRQQARRRRRGARRGGERRRAGRRAAAALPPTAKQLARLDDDQLTRLWEALTAQPAEEAGERFHGSAVAAVRAARAPSNRLASLDLSGVALCGIDGAGKPLPGCSHTSSAVERLCDALRSEHCELTSPASRAPRCARPRRARSRRR